ncbi:MAG: metal-dependent transcriptional regulator [Chloroflexi bacterium]|nr:metal-dependent transcriptional regulator [Chloroflexota bacterium]
MPPTKRPAAPSPNTLGADDLATGHRDEGPSETIARYLEAIFYIDGEGEVVRAARLAEWIGVSQPTVAAALRRMARDGLVESGPSKELSLTPKGRRAAATIVRKHRIAERWLVDALGFDWLTADEEASRMEHGLSMRVADRLHEMIGHPQTCPHGNPIPGVAGDGKRERALASLAPGERAPLRRISEVAEHEVPDLLRFLGDHGFSLGGVIEIVDLSRGAGTISVEVGGRRVSMSTEVARKIWVEAL